MSTAAAAQSARARPRFCFLRRIFTTIVVRRWVCFLRWNEEPGCCKGSTHEEIQAAPSRTYEPPRIQAAPSRTPEQIQVAQTERMLAAAEAENKRLRAQAEAQSRERARNERLRAESVAAVATAPLIAQAEPHAPVTMARAVSVNAAKSAEATVGFLAAVDQSVEAPHHAPVMAPSLALAPAKETEDLSVALKQAKLQQYEVALRELGCAIASDLGALEESDMVEIGMKKYEIKRLQRFGGGGSGGSE
eukprot:COSAG02_NODE_8677_length_2483_cov_2.950084_2_plen_248_part_00